MNAKRLLKLADFLVTVPRKRFDMSFWADGMFCGKPRETKHQCGTTACAFGWATAIPSFRKAGLRLYKDVDGEIGVTDRKLYVSTTQCVTETWRTAERFFGLTTKEAELLFPGQ